MHFTLEKWVRWSQKCKWTPVHLQGRELWPASTHTAPIPSVPFPGMLVCPSHSQTPWFHSPDICCQYKMAYQLVLQSRQSPGINIRFTQSPWKSQCWLKALSYILSFHWVLSAAVMSMDMIQVGVALFTTFIFYRYTLFKTQYYNLLYLVVSALIVQFAFNSVYWFSFEHHNNSSNSSVIFTSIWCKI